MAPQLVIEQRFPQEVSVFKDDVLSLLQSLHPMQLPIRVWHWGPFDPKFCEELFCPPHLKIFFLYLQREEIDFIEAQSRSARMTLFRKLFVHTTRLAEHDRSYYGGIGGCLSKL